ncbi:3-oxoacyl-[acyl-carrier protein] reductase [Kitasatospora sp. MAA4]|uniref:glucose 1-dehydrogenase n=1 Tax=Kitasatospora sp. MAA4 TaxID=3035093 RepID=UPI0024764334|nr:glucose 1-dehydrogenase [Kitasatospora sp. MAA4]MDH6136211.1 3-oxoacyl-[acyl-carrier protein] reductase [Kitasatospora sp. MAA4]
MTRSRFTGQVALVTGAATGIGAATARALAAEGAAVLVNHWRTPEAARAVVDEITAGGGRALAIEANVADADAVTAMVRSAEESFGPVSILVNNAGIISRAELTELTEDEWDRVLNVNLKGVYLCCRAVAPGMIARGAGRIVNISSDLALTGEARLIHYCAAKGGVISLTRALARELIPHGVNVNAIAPGMTETPMLTANPITYNPERERSIPAGRWGTPQDIAASVCFLASAEADYYVGALLSPNGGIVM